MAGLQTAANVIGAFATGFTMVNQAMAPLRQPPTPPQEYSKEVQRSNADHARESAQHEVNAVAEETRERDDARQADLRRDVASRRARLASQGVGSAGGSGQALISGLVDDAHDARADDQKRKKARIDRINTDMAHRHRSNLLEKRRIQAQKNVQRHRRTGYFR